MPKKGFFRRIADAVTAPFRKKSSAPPAKVVTPTPPTPPAPAPKPFSLKSEDAAERARRQKILRAKRRQIEIRNQRTEYQAIKTDRSLRPSERAKRYQGYLRRYGKQQNPYPADETREFWMRFREAGGS